MFSYPLEGTGQGIFSFGHSCGAPAHLRSCGSGDLVPAGLGHGTVQRPALGCPGGRWQHQAGHGGRHQGVVAAWRGLERSSTNGVTGLSP